jgi:hypothetical protein
MDLCQGKWVAEAAMVKKLMDGEAVTATTDREKVILKTFRVLNGDVLYSHSWLED